MAESEDVVMPEYYPLNFELWTLFDNVQEDRKKIELVHIFGEAPDLLSAYYVTCSDEVYGVGRNDFGRLGIGEQLPELVEVPRKIEHLTGKRVTSFACGAMHTLALTESGEVYSWGLNMLGPLGHGTIINRDSPGLVLLPHGVKIKAIGAKCSYSVAITTTNVVYLWGTSPREFHLEGLRPVPPVLITSKEHNSITSIACSRDVTVALNENGKVYVLLSNTPLDIILEAQKTLPVIEIAGAPFSDTPIVFRMGDEGFIRIFPPYEPADSDSYYCSDDMRNIQSAFHGMATPQVSRRRIDLVDSRVHRIQGTERNIGVALYNVKDHSDITVILSDGEVYVHKLILVTFCEHFKSMLLGPWADQHRNDEDSALSSEKKILDMKRYNPRAFRAFLKYVYTGGLDLMQGEDLIDLYDISKSYLEDELVNICSKMFVNIIKANSVAVLYKKASDNECEVKAAKELMGHLVAFASGCLEEVIKSEGFENLESHLAKKLVVNAVKLSKKTH